jgi:hypothetical protein
MARTRSTRRPTNTGRGTQTGRSTGTSTKPKKTGRTYTSTYNPPPPRLKKKSGRTRTGSTVKPITRTPTNTGGATPPSIGNRGKQIRKKPGSVTITPVPSFTDQELKIRQHPPGTAQPPNPTGTARPPRRSRATPLLPPSLNPLRPLRGRRVDPPNQRHPKGRFQGKSLKELDAELRKLKEKLRRAEAMERGPTA